MDGKYRKEKRKKKETAAETCESSREPRIIIVALFQFEATERSVPRLPGRGTSYDCNIQGRKEEEQVGRKTESTIPPSGASDYLDGLLFSRFIILSFPLPLRFLLLF